MITRPLRLLALFALILTSGILALKLAVPPGYASPIWPPAGIALAALMLWGRRMLPAIWLGSLTLNLWLSYVAGNIPSSSETLAAALIATGSTLQAIVAVWLSRTWLKSALPKLDTPHNILKFLGLAGILSCLIAPTIGVTALMLTGLMPYSTAMFSWWNWWIGDSLGVVIAAPLMFSLFGKPAHFWAPRRISVVLPQLVLLTALIVVFLFVFHNEQSRLQAEFDHRASTIDHAVEENLNKIVNGTLSLHDLYEASTDVTEEDFSDFSRGILQRSPEIQILEWLPRVPQAQLSTFEHSIRSHGHPGFQVKELAQDRSLVPVSRRPEYFPIVFIEPMAGNEIVFGFDSTSQALSWHAKELARVTDRPTASQQLRLLQDTHAEDRGILVSMPIFKEDSAHSTSNLTGFISAIFRPEKLVTHALQGTPPGQFGVQLTDLNAPKTARTLYDQPVTHPLARADALRPWQRTFLFCDREWQLTIAPDRSFIIAHGSPLPWITLIGGLIFTALFNIYLLTITGQKAHIEALVETRSSEVLDSEKRLRFLLETSPIAVRIARNGGREVIFANPKYDELIHVEAGQALLVDPKQYYADPTIYEDILHQISHGRRVNNRLIELTIPNYGNKWVLASYLTIKYQGEQAVIGWFYDISDRKKAEEQLVLAARVFSEAHEGITITDANGVIIDVNPTFCEITGFSREEVIGKLPSLLKSGKHSSEFYAAMWHTLLQQGHWQGEVWNRKKSGELYAELLTISALRDEYGNILHYLGLFSDITQSKHQQQALEMMAHYDVLTQLPNRVLFADRFTQAIARCKRDPEAKLAVCYFDLDGFKQVNDTLGHEAGDQLLIQVAERIKSMLREEDTVSRLGGDEFALLLGDIHTLEQCEHAIERIHRTLSQPYLVDNKTVTIGASSGISIFPDDDADPDTLLRHADQAMYQAKLLGRNRFHMFDAKHDQQVQLHRVRLEAIEQGLQRNEFQLHYQPKVNMRTGKVFGAEALIRWIHPEHGLIPPGDFLPTIVGTAFEITLGNWVIEQALAQVEKWNTLGMSLQVSVNISPQHLQWPMFFAHLDAALARHPAIPSHQFELEVLESSVVEDVATISEVLSGCRDALGVNIALDDFGTGYSSLTHLRHLPANMIKIDQSFVRDMLDDPNDYSIIEGVVGLAEAFRRSVIAEGVESAEHGLMLLNMGCILAQGYGISRPMPAEHMVQWVKDYQPHPAWEAYVKNPPSARGAERMALTIQVSQWVRRLKESLHSKPDSAPRWPIMDKSKCHCGRWAVRAKETGLFSDAIIESYSQAHEQLHSLGNSLMYLHQSGKQAEALSKLPELDACVEEILRFLETLD